MDDDQIEEIARALWDAYQSDLGEPREWPPAWESHRLAWRRAAAAAVDLAREGRLDA